MSRTTRKTGRDGRSDFAIKGVRSLYAREKKWARKQTNRKARNQTVEVLHVTEDYDEMIDPRPRSTGGWITH